MRTKRILLGFLDVVFWFSTVFYVYGGTNIGGKTRMTYVSDLFLAVAILYAVLRILAGIKFRDTSFGKAFDQMASAVFKAFEGKSLQSLKGLKIPSYLLMFAAGYLLSLFVAVPILTYTFFGNGTFDFGVIENAIYNGSKSGNFFTYFLMKGDEPGIYFPNNHLDFGLLIFALIYKVLPRPEVLLVAQSLALLLALIPLYKLGKLLLPPGVPRWLPLLAYWFFDPVHRINMWDFHETPFLIPFALWSLYFIEVGKIRWAIVSMFLMSMWRVDSWFTFAGIAAYAAIRTKKWLIFVPLGVAALTVLPLHAAFLNKVNTMNQVYPQFGSDVKTALTTLFTKPWVVLDVWWGHRGYFERLLLLAGGPIALFSGWRLVPLILPLSQLTLANWGGMVQFNTHYPALYIGPLMFAIIGGWRNMYPVIVRFAGIGWADKALAASLAVALSQLAATEPGAFTKRLGDTKGRPCLVNLMKLVPEHVPLLAVDPLATHLTHREWISMPSPWTQLSEQDWKEIDHTEAEWLVGNNKEQLLLGMKGKKPGRPWEMVKEDCGLFIAKRAEGAR